MGLVSLRLGNARLTRYGGGGLGEPTTLDAVHRTRLSMPKGLTLFSGSAAADFAMGTNRPMQIMHRISRLLCVSNRVVKALFPYADFLARSLSKDFLSRSPKASRVVRAAANSRGIKRSSPL